MAPTPLGGSYPYNTGDSAPCRAWKLAATVCTTMPVPYGTDMLDFSCAHSGGFTDVLFGTFCASSAMPQYACSDCSSSCNAGGCSHGPVSLRNCTGTETAIH